MCFHQFFRVLGLHFFVDQHLGIILKTTYFFIKILQKHARDARKAYFDQLLGVQHPNAGQSIKHQYLDCPVFRAYVVFKKENLVLAICFITVHAYVVNVMMQAFNFNVIFCILRAYYQ